MYCLAGEEQLISLDLGMSRGCTFLMTKSYSRHSYFWEASKRLSIGLSLILLGLLTECFKLGGSRKSRFFLNDLFLDEFSSNLTTLKSRFLLKDDRLDLLDPGV